MGGHNCICRGFGCLFFVALVWSLTVPRACSLVPLRASLALWMLPTEQTGDRVAGLVVALLIVMTNLQTDLKLGDLTYLIWVDYFNLMQLCVLLIALIQTMVIHRLGHRKLFVQVIVFDRV